MTTLERTMMALGALDLAYVAWVAFGTFSGSWLPDFWQSTVAFGLPHPFWQVAAIALIYFAIFACGLVLLFRRVALAWLSYVLFPLRVLLVLPTLFPLFVVVAAAGAALHPGIAFALLAGTETIRFILVHRWSRSASAAAKVAGAAA